MSDPRMFSVEDALNLQELQTQRQALDLQIASIVNAYGIEGPAQIIQDPRGRWIGIQPAPEPAKLSVVPDPEPDRVESVS